MTKALAPDSYGQFLADLKGRIRAAQLRASMAVNRELVLLYWQPRYPQPAGAGKPRRHQVTDRLAADLKRAFPDMTRILPAKPEIHAGVR